MAGSQQSLQKAACSATEPTHVILGSHWPVCLALLFSFAVRGCVACLSSLQRKSPSSHPLPPTKAAGRPAIICWRSRKLLRKAHFPAQQKVSALKGSAGTAFINQHRYKKSILINIIILIERSSPRPTDPSPMKDASTRSSLAVIKPSSVPYWQSHV